MEFLLIIFGLIVAVVGEYRVFIARFIFKV